MKLNDLDVVYVSTALPMCPILAKPGRRGFVETLMTRLTKVWIGLYAVAPRRPLPPL